MNAEELFLPIFAIAALAVVAPAWLYFDEQLSILPDHIQFLAALLMPILVLLWGSSWLEPR